jgi:hypothetical protein
MAVLVATTTALVIWVVLWSLGQKAVDVGILAVVIVLLTAASRSLLRHLPGRGSP